MEKQVLWRTRSHPPNEREIEELKRILKCDKVKVVVVKGMIRSAEDVIDLFHRGHCGKPFDEVVVLGPLGTLVKMAEFGVPPITAKMRTFDPNLDEKPDYTDPKTGHEVVFDRFVRILGMREEEL